MARFPLLVLALLALSSTLVNCQVSNVTNATDEQHGGASHSEEETHEHEEGVTHEEEGDHDHDHGDHDDHHHDEKEWDGEGPPPSVSLSVSEDPVSHGLNIRIDIDPVDSFDIVPVEASGPHHPGEGHTHLYYGEEMLARQYCLDYHFDPHDHHGHGHDDDSFKVTLNANDHSEYTDAAGNVLEATATPPPEEEGEEDHAEHMEMPPAAEWEGEETPTLSLETHEDSKGGYNVQVIGSGFAFGVPGRDDGNNASLAFVNVTISMEKDHHDEHEHEEHEHEEHEEEEEGHEGHEHEHASETGSDSFRLYCPFVHVNLPPGKVTITAALHGMQGQPLLLNGEAINATTSLTVPEDHDHAHCSHECEVHVCPHADQEALSGCLEEGTCAAVCQSFVDEVHEERCYDCNVHCDGLEVKIDSNAEFVKQAELMGCNPPPLVEVDAETTSNANAHGVAIGSAALIGLLSMLAH